MLLFLLKENNNKAEWLLEDGKISAWTEMRTFASHYRTALVELFERNRDTKI